MREIGRGRARAPGGSQGVSFEKEYFHTPVSPSHTPDVHRSRSLANSFQRCCAFLMACGSRTAISNRENWLYWNTETILP